MYIKCLISTTQLSPIMALYFRFINIWIKYFTTNNLTLQQCYFYTSNTQVCPEETGSNKNSGSSHKTSYSKTSSVSSSQVKRTSSESSGADDVLALIRNELNQVETLFFVHFRVCPVHIVLLVYIHVHRRFSVFQSERLICTLYIQNVELFCEFVEGY